MTNDAAERLRRFYGETGTMATEGKLLDAALAAERRATVERIRAAFGKDAQLVSEWTAILDAEAAKGVEG